MLYLYPYFVSHVPEFLDIWNIVSLSQQGLEKLNDEITKDYFRSTTTETLQH